MSVLIISILLCPLIGFAINGLGFKTIPKTTGAIIGTLAALGTFICTLSMFSSFDGSAQRVVLFDWIQTTDTQVGFSFLIDQLSLTMLLFVTGVGTLIHLYSFSYMHHDANQTKFFAFLNLFLFSMLVLVLGSNFLVMFIGWEGVGLCSYLLIGFWNKNSNYADAARKAFIMNRIGDVGFLIGIFLVYLHFGSIEYLDVFHSPLLKTLAPGLAVAITLSLFIGAMGKSAQIPLFTWLPDAMAGPTPVSALIHAATMVTAGIYLLIRSNALFVLAPETLQVVSIVGLATALFGAVIGIFQTDIKKVLAYSTVSQLGYMFLGLGFTAFGASLFHVITHAFFKALLFLSAGSVIHAVSDEQDIRKMGGLKKHLPITFYTFLIGTIAISGIPPFSGFFSKDEILLQVFQHNKIMWGLALLGSMITSFYMFRLLFVTFFGSFRGTQKQKDHLHESPWAMTVPLIVLAILSVCGGLINFPEIFGGSQSLNHFLVPIIGEHHSSADHHTEILLMVVSTTAALISAGLAYVIFLKKETVPVADDQMHGIKKLIYEKFRIDELYHEIIVNPLKNLSLFLGNFFETKVIGGLSGNFQLMTNGLSGLASKLQTGKTEFYLFMIVGGIVLIFFNSLGHEFIQGIQSFLGNISEGVNQ